MCQHTGVSQAGPAIGPVINSCCCILKNYQSFLCCRCHCWFGWGRKNREHGMVKTFKSVCGAVGGNKLGRSFWWCASKTLTRFSMSRNWWSLTPPMWLWYICNSASWFLRSPKRFPMWSCNCCAFMSAISSGGADPSLSSSWFSSWFTTASARMSTTSCYGPSHNQALFKARASLSPANIPLCLIASWILACIINFSQFFCDFYSIFNFFSHGAGRINSSGPYNSKFYANLHKAILFPMQFWFE